MEVNFEKFELEGVDLNDICLNVLDYFNTTKQSEAKNIFIDEIYGNISYKAYEDLIEISLEYNQNKITIYQNPVALINEIGESIYKAFNLELLINALKLSSNYYEFKVGKNIKSSDDILKEKPKEIVLIKKNIVDFSIFEPLNNKSLLPLNKLVEIPTNQIIPENIDSLNLTRDKNIQIIIENRDDFINEISNFFNSDDVILKIYGCDGIGKSLSFVYLQSLINKYKIVYFNLKEFHFLDHWKTIEVFKKQLLMYYSTNNTNTNNKEIKNKYNFNRYNQLIKKLDNKINEYDGAVNFWILLDMLMKMNEFQNVLYILDQYKKENDIKNSLDYFENKVIMQNTNQKLLVAFSINDGTVKNDFMDNLKGIIEPNEINNKKDETKGINDSLSDTEEFFDAYEESFNYIDEINVSDEDKELFKKIKDFNKPDIPKKEPNNPKLYDDELIKKPKNKSRIIYINNLISVKNLENNKNKELIEVMKDFNYNPKYYFKWIKFYNSNKSNYKIDEIYPGYLSTRYEHMTEKITKFYKSYFFNFENQLIEKTIVKYLIFLYDLVEKEKHLSLKELINYLNYFPLKYIQIHKVDEIKNEKKVDKNNNIIILDKSLNKFKFKLNFVFPFIKIVIRKYIYDTGIIENLNFSNLSPSGMGSLLEIEVLKKIMEKDNPFVRCEHRTVWGFENIINNNDKDIPHIIDIYNLKQLIIDDGINAKIDYNKTYYITPYNPSNKYLDSLFLIPHSFNQEDRKDYSLISTQMTIKKENIYDLQEYHQSTNACCRVMEKIYNITIKEKYFIFILAKEYDNSSTQRNLKSKQIPFIFYSTNDKMFYFNNTREIKIINELLIKEFKILNDNDTTTKDYLYNKNMNLELLCELLNKKRKRYKIKITKNLYSYARKKIFGGVSLSDIGLIKNKIIKNISQIDLFKNKKIIIEFAFKVPFPEINNINLYNNLLGIFAYNENLFLFYDNRNIKLIYSKNKKDENEEIDKIIKIIFKKSYIGLKMNIHDYLMKKEKIESFNDLINHNKNKPSEIFVYSIYIIDESIS